MFRGKFEDISIVNFMTSMGIYKRSLLIVLSFITFYHLILVSLFSLYISNNLFPHPNEVNGYLHANKKVMKVAFKAHFKALSRFFQGSFKVRERFIFRYVYLISLIFFIFFISFILFPATRHTKQMTSGDSSFLCYNCW